MAFKPQLATTKPAPERTQRIIALAREIWPAGRCRFLVRGFSASYFRSTMRLKAMAQVRAQTMAKRIRPKVFPPGHPRFSRAATSMAANANGSAKIVWEKRTKAPHFCRADMGFRLEDAKAISVRAMNEVASQTASPGDHGFFGLKQRPQGGGTMKKIMPSERQQRCRPVGHLTGLELHSISSAQRGASWFGTPM